jgi:hypothetical protein
MIHSIRSFSLVASSCASLVSLVSFAALTGCSAAPNDGESSSLEPVARSAAADTVWTAVYVGEAHAGSVNRSSNVQAKTALSLASDGSTLYVALYFCGKGSTLSDSTKWLVGSAPIPASGNLADLGGVDVASADKSWSAYVNMTGPGTVTRADGVTLNWVASYVGDGTAAGLFRYVYPAGSVDSAGNSLAGAIAGIIEWNGGSQGALLFSDATVEVIDPLNPAGFTFPTAPASTPIPVAPANPMALVQ